MPTIKKRINISVPREINEALSRLARRDQTPRATKTLRLLETALELEEDTALAAIASSRNRRGAKFSPHRLAWR